MTAGSKVTKLDTDHTVSILDDGSFSMWQEASGHYVEFLSNGKRRVYLDFSDCPILTEQSHKESCDIRNILSQHLRLNSMPPMPEAVFTDLSDLPDYQTCLNTVMSIDSIFQSLPSGVRTAFNGDPAALMAAVEDPAQRDKLVALGVFKPSEGVVKGSEVPVSEPALAG